MSRAARQDDEPGEVAVRGRAATVAATVRGPGTETRAGRRDGDAGLAVLHLHADVPGAGAAAGVAQRRSGSRRR